MLQPILVYCNVELVITDPPIVILRTKNAFCVMTIVRPASQQKIIVQVVGCQQTWTTQPGGAATLTSSKNIYTREEYSRGCLMVPSVSCTVKMGIGPTRIPRTIKPRTPSINAALLTIAKIGTTI
jgi:hypothetical protein